MNTFTIIFIVIALVVGFTLGFLLGRENGFRAGRRWLAKRIVRNLG